MRHKLPLIDQGKPWYAEGLKFECTGCGKCCTGFPGYTWVDENEMTQMAEFLQLPLKDFVARYVRKVRGAYSLLEHSQTYDCVFLKENRCQIYPVRPTQCRTFPWWPRNLKSKQDWDEAARHCEGISPNAPLVPLEKIQEQLNAQEQTGQC